MTVYGEIDVFDGSIGAEDLAEMVLVDIFGELLYYNLLNVRMSLSSLVKKRTFELFGAGGSLPGEARE